MSDDREADQTDAGRGRDVGQGGYPEEQPPGGGGAGGGGGGTGDAEQPSGAPESAPDRDSGSDTATGNPGAAG